MDLGIGTMGLLTALVGVIVTLVRVVERFIVKKKQNGNGVLTPAQAKQFEDLSTFFTRFEVKWEYMERNMKDLVDERRETHESISKLINVSENLMSRMGDLISKIDKLSDEMLKRKE